MLQYGLCGYQSEGNTVYGKEFEVYTMRFSAATS